MLQDNFKDPKLLLTADGSHTLYHENIDETYHSRHGAMQESEHVFIKNGLFAYCQKHPEIKNINILEVGLGTGLNLLLTMLFSLEKEDISFSYTALEAFPPSGEIIEKLNYFKLLDNENAAVFFNKIHSAEWNKTERVLPNFTLLKLNHKLEDFSADQQFDIVYFDAFAPRVQPELWERIVFENLYKHMRKNALLVTYCAKGDVRRNMQSAGFNIERLQGPPGKREMLRAEKT